MKPQNKSKQLTKHLQGQRSRARAYIMILRHFVDLELRYSSFRRQFPGYRLECFERNPVFKGVSADRISAITEVITSPSCRFEDPLKTFVKLEKILPKTLKIERIEDF